MNEYKFGPIIDFVPKTPEDCAREMVEALKKIACFNDKWAETFLYKSGSYRFFYEPASAEIARDVLIKMGIMQ